MHYEVCEQKLMIWNYYLEFCSMDVNNLDYSLARVKEKQEIHESVKDGHPLPHTT